MTPHMWVWAGMAVVALGFGVAAFCISLITHQEVLDVLHYMGR